MKKIAISALLLTLTACSSDASGINSESSKKPLGNPASSIIVEEFSDIQCPACKFAHENIVKRLLDEYGRNIRFEFKHFPLRGIHPFAQKASEASECAADQELFLEFLDIAYKNQKNLTTTNLVSYAEEIGVEDMDLFNQCLRSGAKKKFVDNNYNEAIKKKLTGTPTFIVSGKRIPKNSYELIKTAIEEAMPKQRL
ncbi:thioredoxin domain-containing protein [Candidatus Peribacteria bacterium]|jgi:protein-disulfide isomerase|nr:thioredoxin domain-containing protein [Candidatus Peribacteria bacterium]MBT4021686.1 thioredoxin domain-containing protein [Candidatus Peribacteria bacterium]MBT4240848.1 thioredoxin domain-containing protein [Candidatus Peribacteria bacterium]MBT4473770.1 thioredoxin domain-containing protein [Candidatus Peribacteria bacterium]